MDGENEITEEEEAVNHVSVSHREMKRHTQT